MGLTTHEEIVRVGRLGGQEGRPPLTAVSDNFSSHSDGAAHHSDFLLPARGTRKLTSAPMYPSGYEIRGAKTGILEFPAPGEFSGAYIHALGTSASWGCQFGIKPLAIGDLTDAASGDGQVFFSTGSQIGTHPTGGADIDTVRASLVLVGGVYKVRFRWGVSTFDKDLVGPASVAFDPTKWMWFNISMYGGVGSSTLTFVASQVIVPGVSVLGLASVFSQAVAKGWVVHQFWLGGSEPARKPTQGIYQPCPAVFSSVELICSKTTNLGIFGGTQGAQWVRNTTTSTTSDGMLDSWNLTGDETKPISLAGREARIVGSNVHRSTGIGTAQSGSLDCNGSGMVSIQNSERLRETPKARASGGVEGHFLELPNFSFAILVDPRKLPWRHPSVERACVLCWSTPYATNLNGGVASDPLLGTYPDNVRPSEHLRVELERISTTYYLRVYFGELEPNSLKHPAGTPGGQATTAWPPALSTAGEPPATWNMPQGDPTVGHAAANGKTAFQISLGTDVDATHPMDYSWWVFIQKKFVGQGSGSNACSVFVRRVNTNGTLDTGYAEAKDVNADASGERHPANQSCFAAARLNNSDINYRPDSYVLTIGGDGGSRFGEEKKSYDATTRLPTMYPVDDVLARCEFSDEGDRFPFIGRLASLVVLRRYLLQADRLKIATVGAFEDDLRTHFAEDYILSMNFAEAAGNILRDGRGNDISFSEKIGLAAIANDATIDQPQLVGAFPRPEPPWHNEVDQFIGEYSPINAIVQRIDAGGGEEVYAVAQSGLYSYDRAAHTLTRVATLPGQGGPGQQASIVDSNDIIHVAGGTGRPVVITRERVVAVSGIEPPFYSAPQAIVYQNKTITGGMSITFQTISSTNLNALVGYEIDDAATMGFSIGYWSDALRTRSRPGNVVIVRYVDSQFNPPVVTSPPTIIRYRILVSGLPPPKGANASLITHWEIYRTDSNGRVLLLEKRIPINSAPVAVMIGDIPLISGEEADIFRDIPPEGLKAIVAFGDRIIGVAPPEFPRAVVWTTRRDSMNWPPAYTANMNQTNAPASGCIIRRGRAFPFSRDHFYQLIESGLDASLVAGQMDSLALDTLAEGVGGVSHFAAITDHENGVYLAGNKSVYLTEGGTYRSISLANDSAGEGTGDDFSWPDSWDLSQPDRFTSFHDERTRMVAICGPSAEDPTRIDAMLVFYERGQIASDGRSFMAAPDLSRIKGLDATCAAHILDTATGKREVWLGTQLGYMERFGLNHSIAVDYDWLATVDPKYGEILAVTTTKTLRLDGSFGSYPATDLFRGAIVRVYRNQVMISATRVITATVSASWVDVTTNLAHSAIPGDHWTIGAIPLDWRSGKRDFSDTVSDKRVHAAILSMNE